MTLLMLIVVSVTVLLTTLRFGAGVLEDNFVSQLNTTYRSSVQFMCFYGLVNFYLYTMAYVYSPSDNAVFGKCIISYFQNALSCFKFVMSEVFEAEIHVISIYEFFRTFK